MIIHFYLKILYGGGLSDVKYKAFYLMDELLEIQAVIGLKVSVIVDKKELAKSYEIVNPDRVTETFIPEAYNTVTYAQKNNFYKIKF